MIITGINGFGRFGLHLLKYWLDRSHSAHFKICYINDDFLSLKEIYEIIKNDKYVIFDKYTIRITESQVTRKPYRFD